MGTTIGKKKESFADLDFADDVVLLAEMLSVLVLALEVMNVEACSLSLTINWAKTKIQYSGDPDGVSQCATVQGNQVETYWAAAAVRHCPESSSVVLWPSQPRRFIPGPLPSSAGLHCGHSCRLETKAWPS